MAIKVRRGNKADLVVANLLAGEPVEALDTKEIGFKANDGTMVWIATLNSSGKVIQDALNALSLGGVLAANYPTISSGTWTPTLYGTTTAGTPTYTAQLGSWTKVGKLIFINGIVRISNLGGAVGLLKIGGLPFLIGANESTATYGYASGINGSPEIKIILYENSNSIWLFKTTSGSTGDFVDTDVTNNFNLSGISGFYTVA